jgi:hypothetical protein
MGTLRGVVACLGDSRHLCYMHISDEGKISIGVGLIALGGTGAVVVASGPVLLTIGWLVIGIAAIGSLLLVRHHYHSRLASIWAPNRKIRMISLVGMIACVAGALGFSVSYFWPSVVDISATLPVQIAPPKDLPNSGNILEARPFDTIPNRTDRFGDISILPDDKLRSLTSQFASDMRRFEENLKVNSYQFPSFPAGATEEEKGKIFLKSAQDSSEQSARKRNLFRDSIYQDMLSIDLELKRRLNREGILVPESEPTAKVALSGYLAGPAPIADAASYLERLAHMLRY